MEGERPGHGDSRLNREHAGGGVAVEGVIEVEGRTQALCRHREARAQVDTIQAVEGALNRLVFAEHCLGEDSSPMVGGLTAVSYTHLDVYKRQVVDEVLDLATGDADGAAYTIARKRLGSGHDGPARDLILVSARGSYGSEWLSNLDMSRDEAGDHGGYVRAAREIGAEVVSWAEESRALGAEVSVLLVGHSRGGAIANLVAAELDDLRAQAGDAASFGPDVYKRQSEFVAAVEANRVDEATYTVLDGTVEGTYWPEGEKKTEGNLERFSSTYVGSDALAELMAAHPKTTYKVDTEDPDMLMNLLVAILPTGLLIFVMFYFMRQMTGANNKAMQFGKTNAKTTEATRPNVKFKDVAGIDEAVEELEEAVSYTHLDVYKRQSRSSCGWSARTASPSCPPRCV